MAEEAGRILAARYPGLCIAGTFAGDASPLGDPATRAAIKAAGAVDVLLVAYGAPRQEAWMARNGDLGIPLSIGVGGTLNFITGRSPVPPRGCTTWGWGGRIAWSPSRGGGGGSSSCPTSPPSPCGMRRGAEQTARR